MSEHSDTTTLDWESSSWSDPHDGRVREWIGRSPWTGGATPGTCPLIYDDLTTWSICSEAEWASWSQDKRDAVSDVIDELNYVLHRNNRPGHSSRAVYLWTLVLRATR